VAVTGVIGGCNGGTTFSWEGQLTVDGATITGTGTAPRPRSLDGTSLSPGTWNLASDFAASPATNPAPDANGNSGVWSFMQSTSLAHDGNYGLLPTYHPGDFGISGYDAWSGTVDNNPCGWPNQLPEVAINTTAQTISPCGGITVAAHGLSVHPAGTQMAVVGWRSPITGVVTVSGGVHDNDPNCGDGIGWSIDAATLPVAAGSISNGGSAIFPAGLTVSVTKGGFLYFLVDPNAGIGCDSTGLDVTIAGGTVNTPTVQGPGADWVPSFSDFGTVALNQPGPTRDVALHNTGTETLNVTSISLAGPNSDSFTVAGDSCSGKTVDPGSACTVSVSFKPTAVATMNARIVASDTAGAQTAGLLGVGRPPVTWVAPTPLNGSDLLALPGGARDFQVVGQFEPGVTGAIVSPTDIPGLSCTPIGNISSPRLAEADCDYRPGGRQSLLLGVFSAVRSDGTTAGDLQYSFASQKYVALGDSYSAGEGVYTKDEPASSRRGAFAQALHASGSGSPDYLPGTDTKQPGNGNQCHRSASSGYPRLFAALVGLSFSNDDFWACSGSLVSDITNDGGNSQWGQYPDDRAQTSHLGHDTTLVTMTAGGNDARFADVIKDCFSNVKVIIQRDHTPCFANGVDQQVSGRIAGLRASLRDALYAISTAAPHARILVAGYPHLYNLDGSGGFSSGCGALSSIEKQWLNAKAAEADGVIAEVVKNSGVAEYVEAYDMLGTQNGQHQICGSDDPWINGIVADPRRGIKDGAYAASFHPNDGGYHEYARRFASVYREPQTSGTPYTINQFQTIRASVTVPPQTPVMRFSTRWAGSDVTMNLTSPSGRAIDRATVASDVAHFAGPTFEVYTVANPETGTWTVTLYGNTIPASGEIVRLDAGPLVQAPSPPTPVVIESTSSGQSPLAVTFDASTSTASKASISNYQWDFGDGSTATGPVVTHIYATPGSYGPGVVVTDSAGALAATAPPAVTVSAASTPPVPRDDGPVGPVSAGDSAVTSSPRGLVAFTGANILILLLDAVALLVVGTLLTAFAWKRRPRSAQHTTGPVS